MITRTVRLQLAAFALLSVTLVAILSANYVGLTDKIAGGSYVVSAELAQSGGIFVGAEVTYRGVTVGKVETLRLSGDGVVVDARLDRGTEVPKDTRAVVENRSAVGEQYLDLQPRTAKAPFLAAGDVIPRSSTAFPLRIDQLLQHVNDTVSSVPRGDLVTTVDELDKAFKGGGTDLQRLIDSGNALTSAASEALPQTTRLIDDGRIVLDTQVKSGADIRTSVSGFADVADTLRQSDPDLRLVLDRGSVAVGQLDALISENKQSLAALLANFITIGNVTTARLDGIEQLLVTYPDVVTGGFTVVPGDGTAHFGLVLNVDDPKACEAGYEGTKKIDPHQTTNLPPVNLDAHCAAARGSGTDVRGAQNAPKPTRGGQGGQSYPLAFGATPVALGNQAVTSGSPESLSVQSPVAPTGAGRTDNGTSWLWMMQEALH
ncbi:MlaD family protein [Terrabacter aerolatus]|uniref:ABC transporter substrate-binding protein n=1 Tax=Terrabacter aerolatus TaxID=422442 RepID=A0A512D1B2_9MICO|nr:MlaD family protein [Terrabacter aerolatus]GEO30257.1 ABC transporter substrate-binding protein [Terrabacter aerolatus]